MWSEPLSIKPNAHPQKEEYCPVAIHNPLTGYEPKQLDNSDNSETYAVIFQNESVDIDTEPSYSCDAELDDERIGDEQLPQDQQLLHEQLLEQNWNLREAHEKSLSEMEELKRFQGSTFKTQSQEEDWSKIEILSLN